MKRFIRNALSLLTLICVIMTCGSCMDFTKIEEITVETDVPPKIVFLGDSIAAGFGLEGYSDDDLYSCDSYANILRERYAAELEGKCRQITVNRAVTGDTSEDLIALLESGELDEALADSDAVVVSIGGNDMLAKLFELIADIGYSFETKEYHISDADWLSLVTGLLSLGSDVDAEIDEFAVNLRRIAALIHERTGAALIVQTLYNPFETFDDVKKFAEITEDKVGRFNATVTENAEYEGERLYYVADVAPAFEGKCRDLTNIMDIDIHPNAEGHKRIADVVDTAVREHTYTYPDTVEVTDTDAVNLFTGLCIAGAVVTVGIIVIVVIAVVRSKKKRG